MTIDIRQIADTFAVLRPDLGVDAVPVTDDLYEKLDADYDAFRGHTLVSQHEFAADWPTWEMHPAGDELVLLLEGSVTFVLRTGAGDESVELTEPGSYVIVPRDTWHTARVTGTARMLFITPGEGTENREQPI